MSTSPDEQQATDEEPSEDEARFDEWYDDVIGADGKPLAPMSVFEDWELDAFKRGSARTT